MNIIERGRAYAQALHRVAERTVWDWRRCPKCGDTLTYCWGSYRRKPWFLDGRQEVVVQRHKCNRCSTPARTFTYSERSALLVGGSWYAREVHRLAIDHWLHVGSSLRRTAELIRSLLGHQERWRMWCGGSDESGKDERRCHLSQSTVQRWLKRAGEVAKKSVDGQLQDVAHSGQMGTDGLWARLDKGTKRVVLLLVDTVTAVIYPPVVVKGEEAKEEWEKLFKRAQKAGLRLDELLGLVSDGARGLGMYLREHLYWVNHQRCVFHIWRNLGGALAQGADAAIEGLSGDAAKAMRRQVRGELVGLVRQVLDGACLEQAHQALEALGAHQYGANLAQLLKGYVEEALVYRKEDNRGLARVGPEWCWRDYRLRLSRGRNQGSDDRLELGSLVWAIYHNFEPGQVRSERKRKYRRSGLSPLALSGQKVVGFSYLDALGV